MSRSLLPRGSEGWLGLGAGLLLLLLYALGFMPSFSVPAIERLAYVGVGVVTCMASIRIVSAELASFVSRRFGGNRRYGVHVPSAAVVYLVILLVLLLGSMLGRANISSSNMLMLVFGLMAGPFIVNGSITFWMLRTADIRRKLPDRAFAGDYFPVEVELENRAWWISSWIMLVRDVVQSDNGSLTGAVLFTRVPPRSARRASYQACVSFRGLYRFGPLSASSRFPLGLVERSLTVDRRDSLLVYPRLGRLTPRWRDDSSANAALRHESRPQRGALDDEFHHLREYRAGDNPRSIHWRTSARRNELMTREFHQNRHHDLVLLLDLWQPDHPGDDDRERVELAVSLAASLCVDQCQHPGDSQLHVALVGSTSQHWSAPSLPSSLDQALRQFALVAPGRCERLSATWSELAHIAALRRSQCVVLTSRSTAECLAAAASVPANIAGQFEILEISPATIHRYLAFEQRTPAAPPAPTAVSTSAPASGSPRRAPAEPSADAPANDVRSRPDPISGPAPVSIRQPVLVTTHESLRNTP